MSRFWTFTQRTDNSPNHSVEANRRPAAPLEAARQFGSSFSAPLYFPAAVAHLWRSTMEQKATRSNVLPPGLSCDSVAAPAPSGMGRSHGISPGQAALPLTDCTSGFRAFRVFRGYQEHIPSNHSVEANRRPAPPLGAAPQFGSPFSARSCFPAAVAHLWR